MTIAEVIKLRQSGCVEEAYDAIRSIYKHDHSNGVKAVMFWTAFDMMKVHIAAHNTNEARPIYMALLRLLPTMPDPEGKAAAALERMHRVFDKDTRNDVNVERQHLGQWGEEQAATFLRNKGYRIIAHDWKSKTRDIDLVCTDGTTIVFVEVKTRQTRTNGNPEDAVDADKCRNIQRSIFHFLTTHHWLDADFRFDIVAVVGRPGTQADITHWQDVALM